MVMVSEYRFTSLHNKGNIGREGRPKSGHCSTVFEWLQRFFVVHTTIDNTAHSSPLNSLELCICTLHLHNLLRDSTLMASSVSLVLNDVI